MAASMRHSSFSKCLESIKYFLIAPNKNNIPINHLCSSSSQKHLHPKIPKKSVWKEIDKSTLPEETKIDFETIKRIEKLALVKFANQEGIERLNRAIRVADQITLIDTTGVEPMHSLLEDRTLHLREDVVTEGGNAEETLKNSAKVCEDYFVVPSAKGISED